MQEREVQNGVRLRGRPRVRRRMDPEKPFRCYAPQCNTTDEELAVTFLPEEIELLNLVDLNGLGQEEAGAVMGISRRTVWKDLHEARRKVADALLHGKRIEIAGCEQRTGGNCPKETGFCAGPGNKLCPLRHQQEDLDGS